AKAWPSIGFLALLAACGLNGFSETTTVTAEVNLLTQSTQCGNKSSEASVEWIADGEAYASAYNRTQQHIVGDASKPPLVDFARQGVIAVYMGRRPTAGYGLGLASRNAEVEERGVLTLVVSWIEPLADAVLAQVITSPCLLVSVPKGDYVTIQVVDGDGRVRALSASLDR
ncbi:MAG: protease complex subunit PrcB family protein, partial [Betaproteobacteria bacterium]